ncbi:hypothetical protein M3Y99_00889100 [Aphelenchoides fujianensis]|nr:hypothetical protein M3Y99_00889100 [Aphelenchoides fujianensis]
MKFKLHYFDFRGRAEPIRLMFAFTSTPYENHTFTLAEWPQKKASYPNGQVPLLEVDGTPISQSMAIYRFLGRNLGLNGKSELEAAQLDSTAELFRDFIDKALPYLQVVGGFRPGDAEKLRKELFLPAIEQFGPQLEKKLKDAGSGWFGRSGVSWVDFYVGEVIRTAKQHEAEVLKKCPLLMAHNEKLYQLHALQSYLKQRGEVPF